MLQDFASNGKGHQQAHNDGAVSDTEAGKLRRQLRYNPVVRSFRRLLSSRPHAFFLLARLAGNKRLLDKATELVVDGYPRSGNSFTEAAFLYSQRRRGIALRTHAHAAAQVLRAIHRSIPTVILVRDPDEAIASMIAASGVDRPAMHYRDYCAVYRPLVGLERHFLIAEFRAVVSQFDSLVTLINQRFGLGLEVPHCDEEFFLQVAKTRDFRSIETRGAKPNYSAASSKEETLRREQQQRIHARLRRLDTLPSRQAAYSLHRHFNDHADLPEPKRDVSHFPLGSLRLLELTE